MDILNENLIDDNMLKIELLLNIFTKYFKQSFPENKLNNMFDNISSYDDTNKMMEHFYQCMNDYKVAKYQSSIDYDEEKLDEIEEQYILEVNGIKKHMSDNIFSLLFDIINNDYTDWNILS